MAASSLGDDAERLLACPRCRSRFAAQGGELRCQNAACGYVGLLTHDVVVLGDTSALSFFDDRHEVMTEGNASEGVRCLCYERQAGVVEAMLKPGMIVLDIGCGPTLPYTKPADTYVIGLEASYESIRVNREVDMRVYGSALEAPLADRSVDLVLAYYAVHHITGTTVAQNRQNLMRTLRELGRVVKPGGELAIFEVSPWLPVWHAERLLWNTARKVLGPKLDMFFYAEHVYEAAGRAALPPTAFSVQRFDTSMLSTFPPAFSLPWLQVPRFLYPFNVNLYRWRF
ncbi:MAG: class I SAM-dependent methyltransferase [Chloroflexi bacterium]|nr:class I SAM-dependent methyltransferase [Chloroflexota bacterium]